MAGNAVEIPLGVPGSEPMVMLALVVGLESPTDQPSVGESMYTEFNCGFAGGLM
jgi:hypothetical protein